MHKHSWKTYVKGEPHREDTVTVVQ
jgi:hypothetical protein